MHRYGALVNDSHNSELYARYKAVADKEKNVIFGGRLAEYKYYDMAPIVDKELSMFD
ncbi:MULTISPECIES: UDP-galactopyranose mutase [Prevotellaceae]|uniref:UDP-galactopyranose mutase n=1 Tax=Prevotellaceae TaxID=171552 RepID=UPI000ACD6BE3|nr:MULTISPECIES: UDP-galactopyranose mutase [Prevotellaceae]